MSWRGAALIGVTGLLYTVLLVIPKDCFERSCDENHSASAYLLEAQDLRARSLATLSSLLWPFPCLAAAVGIWFTTRTNPRILPQVIAVLTLPVAMVFLPSTPHLRPVRKSL